MIAIIGAVALTGALAGFAAGHRRRTAPPAPDPIAFTLAPPPGARFRFTIEEDGVQLAPPVVSPDGRRVVFGVVDSDGIRRLLIRDLDNIESRAVSGSEDSRCPFWSPDGQSVGFFAGCSFQTLALSGAAPVAVAANAADPRGASWGADGTILYAPSPNSGLFEIPEEGGTPVQVTVP